MNRLIISVSLALVFIAFAAAQTPEVPRMPTQQEIIQMRRELQSRQREREAGRMRTQIIEVRPITNRPQSLPRENRFAALRVVHEMDSLRVICRFRPSGRTVAASTQSKLISLPLIHRGENWLVLEPGDWNIELLVGVPGEGAWESIKLPVTALQPDRAYELAFGEVVERQLKRSLGTTAPAATPQPAAEAPRDDSNR